MYSLAFIRTSMWCQFKDDTMPFLNILFLTLFTVCRWVDYILLLD